MATTKKIGELTAAEIMGESAGVVPAPTVQASQGPKRIGDMTAAEVMASGSGGQDSRYVPLRAPRAATSGASNIEATDVARAIGSGFENLAGSVNSLLEWTGAEIGSQGLQDFGQRGREYWQQASANTVAGMTPDAQKELSREFTPEEGIFSDESALDLTNWRSLVLKLAQTSPTIAAGVVPGIGAAGWAARAGMGARGIATAGAVGGGAAEGAMVTGFVAGDVAQAIDEMPEEQLKELPQYEEVAALGLDGEELRAEIKRNALKTGGRLGLLTGVATGALGGAGAGAIAQRVGIPVLGKAATRTGAMMRGSVVEGAQESLQEFTENASKNIALGRPYHEGGLESAVGGLVLGAGMGGGIQGVAFTPDQRAEEAAPEEAAPALGNVGQDMLYPEPPTDIAAQIKQMLTKSTDKSAVFISQQSVERSAKVIEQLKAMQGTKGIPEIFFAEDENYGVFISTDKFAVDAVRESNFADPVLAVHLGYRTSKRDIDDPETAVFVRKYDAADNVVEEQLVDQRHMDEVYTQMELDKLDGQRVEKLTQAEAVADRQKRYAEGEDLDVYDLTPPPVVEEAIDTGKKKDKKGKKGKKNKFAVEETAQVVESPVVTEPPSAIPVPGTQVEPTVDSAPAAPPVASTPVVEDAPQTLAPSDAVTVPTDEKLGRLVHSLLPEILQAQVKKYNDSKAHKVPKTVRDNFEKLKTLVGVETPATRQAPVEEVMASLADWDYSVRGTRNSPYSADAQKLTNEFLYAADPASQELALRTLHAHMRKTAGPKLAAARALARKQMVEGTSEGTATKNLIEALGVHLEKWGIENTALKGDQKFRPLGNATQKAWAPGKKTDWVAARDLLKKIIEPEQRELLGVSPAVAEEVIGMLLPDGELGSMPKTGSTREATHKNYDDSLKKFEAVYEKLAKDTGLERTEGTTRTGVPKTPVVSQKHQEIQAQKEQIRKAIVSAQRKAQRAKTGGVAAVASEPVDEPVITAVVDEEEQLQAMARELGIAEIKIEEGAAILDSANESYMAFEESGLFDVLKQLLPVQQYMDLTASMYVYAGKKHGPKTDDSLLNSSLEGGALLADVIDLARLIPNKLLRNGVVHTARVHAALMENEHSGYIDNDPGTESPSSVYGIDLEAGDKVQVDHNPNVGYMSDEDITTWAIDGNERTQQAAKEFFEKKAALLKRKGGSKHKTYREDVHALRAEFKLTAQDDIKAVLEKAEPKPASNDILDREDTVSLDADEFQLDDLDVTEEFYSWAPNGLQYFELVNQLAASFVDSDHKAILTRTRTLVTELNKLKTYGKATSADVIKLFSNAIPYSADTNPSWAEGVLGILGRHEGLLKNVPFRFAKLEGQQGVYERKIDAFSAATNAAGRIEIDSTRLEGLAERLSVAEAVVLANADKKEVDRALSMLAVYLGDMMHTVTHESHHALSVIGYDLDKAKGGYTSKLLDSIYEGFTKLTIESLGKIDPQVLEGSVYGNVNVYEFIAEGHSSPLFQQRLNKTALSEVLSPEEVAEWKKKAGWDKATVPTLWQVIKNIFNTLLYVGRTAEPSVADALFYAMPKIVKETSNGVALRQYVGVSVTAGVDVDKTAQVDYMNMVDAARSVDDSVTAEEFKTKLKEVTGKSFGEGNVQEFNLPKFNKLAPEFKKKRDKLHEAIIDKSEKTVGKRHSELMSTFHNLMKNSGLAVQTLNQLIRTYKERFVVMRNGVKVRVLDKFAGILRHKVNIVNMQRKAAEDIIVEWQDILKDNRPAYRELNEVMGESSMYGVDPSVSWAHANNRVWKNSKEEASRKQKWAELSSRLNKIQHPKARKVFNKVKDYYRTQIEKTRLYSITGVLKTKAKELGILSPDGYVDERAADTLASTIIKMKKETRKEYLTKWLVTKGTSEADAKKLAKELTKTTTTIGKVTSMKGVYFPFRRFGEYITVARVTHPAKTFANEKAAEKYAADINSGINPDFLPGTNAKIKDNTVSVSEEIVEFHVSDRKAEQRRNELIEEYGEVNVSRVKMKAYIGEQASSADAARLVAKTFDNLPEDSKLEGTVKTAIERAYLQLQAEKSSRKAAIRRKNGTGVAGYSDDMMRVFAERATSGAWMMADLRTAHDQSQIMRDLRGVADAKGTDLGRVVNELAKREDLAFRMRDNNMKTVESLISKTGFYWFLASPSYSAINATQPFVLTLPYLTSKYGAKAMPVMMKQWGFTGKFALSEFRDTKMGTERLPDKMFDAIQNALGQGKERKVGYDARKDFTPEGMLGELFSRQLIDASFIQELFLASSGATNVSTSENALLNNASDAVHGISTAVRGWPQIVEQLNRVSTGLATYELEMDRLNNSKKPKESSMSVEAKHRKAVDEAFEAIDQTQLDYSDLNRPRLFKAIPGGRAIFMFQMYSQGVAMLFARNFNRGVIVPLRKLAGSSDPLVQQVAKEEMAEARRTFTYLMMSHTAAAGVMGASLFPIRFITEMVQAAFGDEDDWKYEREIPNLIHDVAVGAFGEEVGPKVAEILSYGGPEALGMAASVRLGVANLFTMSKDNYSDTYSEAAEMKMLGIFGPVGSAVQSGARGFDYISNGDIDKGIAAIMPKGVRDFIKAFRITTEGLTDYNGVNYEGEEAFNFIDGLIQASGFTTATEGRVARPRRAKQKFERTITNRRDKLLKKYFNKDTDERAAFYRSEIQEFNKQYPSARITMGDIARKRSSMRKKSREYSRGDGHANKYRETKDAVRF